MNLLRDLPDAGAAEIVERLAGNGATRIERIVSHGQASPEGFWYDQDEAEFVLVLAGAARLEFADGAMLTLGPGDFVDIAPRHRHRVEWTNPDCPTVWLAVFYKPCHSGRSEVESRNP
ncbi:MAG TPA: cupin domain-containing protein [Stellaceae bacterium]|jgi:cupin 2 domain-containing protein|nr:cupin domain-containing protein [Stellaceae bacterium]